jgi:uncharacterized protein (TIGR02246 family)
MTDDVIFMVPGEQPFGKEAFAAASRKMGDTRIDGTSEIVELKVLGDWAYIRNRIDMTATPPGGEAVRRSGYTLTLLHMEADGHWRLARDANLLTTRNWSFPISPRAPAPGLPIPRVKEVQPYSPIARPASWTSPKYTPY